jgi:hypothetical protein
MKKIALGFVVVLIFILSGCAMSDDVSDYKLNEEIYGNSGNDGTPTVDPTIFDEDASGGNIADFSDNPVLANRKIIYIANLAILADDLDDVYDGIVGKLVVYSAYIEEEEITENRYELTIRVLSVNMMDFVNDIKDRGELVSYSKTSEDITNSYSTFEARKAALETQHARILELIEIAVDLNDILTLEAERVELETELNEIGLQLATFDSLVDYSTINLIMVKTEDVIELLPRTDKPYLSVEEYDTNSISVKVFNTSESTATVYLLVKDNGVLVETFEQSAYGISYLEFTLEDLDPDTSYSFEIYAEEDDHSVSLTNLSTITTNKTFFIKVADVFVISFNALVSIASFLGLAVTAIAPFAVVGGILYFPTRYLYIKKVKPKMIIRESKLREERAKRNSEPKE